MTDFDLHIHGKHSGGVSPEMEIPIIAEEAEKKGLDIVGTGDILNPKWLRHVKEETVEKNGYLKHGDIKFLPTTEVEDENRIHHLIIFPKLETVEKAYQDFQELSDDIRREGRPRIKADGEKIVEIAKKHDCLIGPCHAFTPYTAIYGKKDSLKECYGNQVENLDFLELGLSADSKMASKISAHKDLIFLSNSDAHSPWPHRLGREFNRAELEEESFEGLKKLFEEKAGELNLNVGLDPREGKYHCSACNSCHQKYSVKEAKDFDWSCQECSETIKKGVKDRVNELSDREPGYRVDYLHLPPLAKIIQYTVGHASPTTKTVQKRYKALNEEFGAEIDILVEKDIQQLAQVDREVAESIRKFRNDEIVMIPGGGGEYGERIILEDNKEKEKVMEKKKDEINCCYRN
ncbi:MAG: TIGR00375 family protein [Nanohaloarchaea archaeon SW_7_46_7]|nr:MAG: TIGR00375 family protein [Nanohaloarchaea archaeon SW_7_46_7]